MSLMKINIINDNNNYVIAFEGKLDTLNSVDAMRELRKYNDLDEFDITIDCSRLEYVSSSGLRIFLTLLKKARMKGHMVTISNANKYLIQVFDDAGFTRLFTMK